MNFIKHLQEFQLMITCYCITYLHSLQESSDFIVLFMSISESNTRFSVKQLDALRQMIEKTIYNFDNLSTERPSTNACHHSKYLNMPNITAYA